MPTRHLEPLEPKVRITGSRRVDVRKSVVARYEEDHATIRAIAEELDRSYGFVLNLLNEAKTKLRPPSTNNYLRRHT